MKRKIKAVGIMFLALLLVGFLIIGGCAKPAPAPAPAPTPTPAPTPAPAPPPKPAWSPTKTITWVAPFSPGGGYDTYSRAIARFMAKDLGVDIIIRNIPGAGGRTGTSFIYRSKPDGHTLGILNLVGLIGLDLVEKTELYDLSKFTYLGEVMKGTFQIVVNADSPFYTLEDLQKAEKVSFSMSGAGASSWISARLVKAVMGIPATEVSGYAGSTQFILAVIRGDANACSSGSIESELPYMKTGDLRSVIQLTIEPDPLIPDTPTLKGTGYEELAALNMPRTIVAPPDMPKEIADVLEASLMKTLKSEEFLKWAKEAERGVAPATAEEATETLNSLQKLLEKYKDAFK